MEAYSCHNYSLHHYYFFHPLDKIFKRRWVQAVSTPLQIMSKYIKMKENALLGNFTSIYKSGILFPDVSCAI
jgi:hypothetical protein